MTNDLEQNIKYLWIPDTHDDGAINQELSSIIGANKEGVPLKILKERLEKRFNFNPIIEIKNKDLDRALKVCNIQHPDLYIVRDEIVYDLITYNDNFIANN